MSNFLKNGTVLPSGLVGVSSGASSGAFRKTYQNCYLRTGIVNASYEIGDIGNINKSVPEYDVLVFEQNEDRGATPIIYKHCVFATSFGSKVDFFEAHLRTFTKKSTKNPTITSSGQNGAVVLLLCLNGLSDTGIIISALSHPDRSTTLIDAGPHLEGEYNGVNIKVNQDGSTSLSFNGAKDSDGKLIDSSQGTTTLKIEKDGSFQVDNSSTQLRLDKNGTITLTAKKDANIVVQGDANITASGKAIVKASEINLNGAGGQILTTTTDPVIDTIFGIPTTGVPTVKSG